MVYEEAERDNGFPMMTLPFATVSDAGKCVGELAAVRLATRLIFIVCSKSYVTIMERLLPRLLACLLAHSLTRSASCLTVCLSIYGYDWSGGRASGRAVLQTVSRSNYQSVPETKAINAKRSALSARGLSSAIFFPYGSMIAYG